MIHKTALGAVAATALALAAMPTAASGGWTGLSGRSRGHPVPRSSKQASGGFPFRTAIAAGAATPNACAWWKSETSGASSAGTASGFAIRRN